MSADGERVRKSGTSPFLSLWLSPPLLTHDPVPVCEERLRVVLLDVPEIVVYVVICGTVQRASRGVHKGRGDGQLQRSRRDGKWMSFHARSAPSSGVIMQWDVGIWRLPLGAFPAPSPPRPRHISHPLGNASCRGLSGNRYRTRSGPAPLPPPPHLLTRWGRRRAAG